MFEIESIIEKELKEAEIRIYERDREVVVRELNEARKNIRKKLIDFMISLREGLRKVEEMEASKQIYIYTPIGKGEKKTFVEIISEHRELDSYLGEPEKSERD